MQIETIHHWSTPIFNFITFAGVTLTSKLRFLNLHHLEGSTLTIEELDITEDVDNTENELFESAHFNIEEQIYMQTETIHHKFHILFAKIK